MSARGLAIIDQSVEAANIWINQVDAHVGWDHKQRAYRLLRAVLHVLRDHLGVEEAAQFAAQMPTLIRGIYYEGWNPSRAPVKMRSVADVAARLQRDFETDPLDDVAQAVAAVVAVLRAHVSAGEMEDVERAFTMDVRRLFG
jgi:uncharacterized protein (DUF2267 family)